MRAPLALFEQLSEVYADADALFEGWSCPTSTECCRFGVTGREPYVTSIEFDSLRRAFEATGRRLAATGTVAQRRPAATNAERPCPLLGSDGACRVYAARPLGCRTFWCDRAMPLGRARHAAVGELVRRLQAIAARHEPGGEIGRPLTRALASSR